MARVKVPYLVAKNGRFYFQPSAELRRAGFQALAFGADERAAIAHCRAEAARFAGRAEDAALVERPAGFAGEPNDLRAKRAGETSHQRAMAADTVSAAIAEFQASARYRAKKPKTRRGYDHYLARIDKLWGPAPLAAVTPEALARAYDAIHGSGAVASAQAFGAVARLFFKWAARRRRLADPTVALELERPAAATRIASPAEVLALIAAADRPDDAGGRADPLVGTGVLMALFLPHNPQDLVKLTVGQVAGGALMLTRGKTGERSYLTVPEVLSARILAAAARRPDGGIDNEARILPVSEQRLAKRYARVRARAALALPSLADLELRALRRTARSWAEAGGASLAQAANLLGHSQAQAARLARHYSVAGPALAQGALAAVLTSAQGAELAAGLGLSSVFRRSDASPADRRSDGSPRGARRANDKEAG